MMTLHNNFATSKLCPQEGMPVCVTGLHFINVPNNINNELSCLYLLMNDEFLQLIHVHHTLDSFYQFVPQHILPCDYGGSGLSVKQLNGMVLKEKV